MAVAIVLCHWQMMKILPGRKKTIFAFVGEDGLFITGEPRKNGCAYLIDSAYKTGYHFM